MVVPIFFQSYNIAYPYLFTGSCKYEVFYSQNAWSGLPKNDYEFITLEPLWFLASNFE